MFLGCDSGNTRKVPFVIVKDPSDILPIDDLSQVPKALYNVQIDLDKYTIKKKKDLFIRLLLPSVLAVHEEYSRRYERVNEVMNNYHKRGSIEPSDSLWLNPLKVKTYARDYWDLRRRLKPNPVSIVLAQAAIESGWGTSRMFLTANHVFGVWSFDPDEPRIEENASRNGRQVYLRRYASVEE